MSGTNLINLFQSKAQLSPFWGVVERYLRVGRAVCVFILLGGGVTIVSLYIFATMQHRSLESQQKQLYSIVTQYAEKEVMLRSLRARVLSLQSIMKEQISVAPYIDTTLLIAQPPVLTAFSIGDKNSVAISVKTATMEEAVALVDSVISLTNEKKILHPVLSSFAIDKDGSIAMSLTYGVVLTQ